MPEKFECHIPVRRELVVFVLLFGLAVALRFLYLGADPPQGITFSQAIETDPPQYTVFARNDVLAGDWNPYSDNRYITYQYSLISAGSRAVFGLFGVGTYQANLVAVILSLLSLLAFYLTLRRALGNGTALAALFFVAINFLGIFFGRRPFLEVGMNLLFLLGLLSLAYFHTRLLGHLLFGIFTAASMVFGKVIGIAFLAVPAACYGYSLVFLNDRKTWGRLATYAIGFLTVCGLWYMLIFAPHADAVAGYVGEQAFGLYGMPEGLQSFTHFIWKMTVFGKDSEFFDRMPTIAIGASFTLLLIAGMIFRDRRHSDESPLTNIILIALAAWLVGTYVAQSPWNYQPVRYQTTLIFPLAGLAAAGLMYLYRLNKAVAIFNRSAAFNAVLLVILTTVVYQVVAAVFVNMGYTFYFKKYFPFVLGMTGPLVIIYFILSRRLEATTICIPGFVRYTLIILLVGLSLVYHGRNYLDWARTPLYTAQQASRDLGTILSPAAVISGPFGPALAMDNDLGCIIHIFGTSRPDSLLFRKYPITHLALEQSNEAVARKLYPDIMEHANRVAHYYVNCRKITIYRIAYRTGNEQAAEYFPTAFERAIHFYSRNRIDSAEVYLDRFQQIYPDNATANTQEAYASLVMEDFDRAIAAAERAVAFAPTDFYLHYILSKAYIGKADESGDDSLRQLSQRELELATKYNLGYLDFDDEYIKQRSVDSLEGIQDVGE